METKIREWYVSQALSSFVRLNEILPELTAAEVTACLELESATGRRRSILDRLISRASRLNEIEYTANLKRKYHGTRTK